jgi:kumamolisin
MSTPGYRYLEGSQHPHPSDHVRLHATDPGERLTVTLMLRRKSGHTSAKPNAIMIDRASRPSRDKFAADHGADATEMSAVASFAKSAGLEILESDQARRTVIVQGTAADVQKAFGVQLNAYRYARGQYRSHDDKVQLPTNIADYVKAVIGLTNRKVEAKHFSTAAAARKRAQLDPPKSMTRNS